LLKNICAEHVNVFFSYKITLCFSVTKLGKILIFHRVLQGESAILRKDVLLVELLTPWSRLLLEKLTGAQLLKKFSAF
jgi:small neutral amino acid transporter SnatA (MarC family)